MNELLKSKLHYYLKSKLICMVLKDHADRDVNCVMTLISMSDTSCGFRSLTSKSSEITTYRNFKPYFRPISDLTPKRLANGLK